MKRHEVLGRNLSDTREVTLGCIERSIEKHLQRSAPGQPQQQFSRQLLIMNAVALAVMEHLGYGPIGRLAERLHAGVDQALDYFLGDWWKADEHDARALDWSRPDRELVWYDVLQDGLLLAALTGRWGDVARICGWFRVGLNLENRFEMKGYEYQQLFFGMALSLRDDPPHEADAVLADVRGCKAKRARLLAAAWDAARARDQGAFGKALKEAVALFLKSAGRDAPNVCFWVDRSASFVWLVAERNGLHFPSLPPPADAAVVRKQTVFSEPDSPAEPSAAADGGGM